MLFSKEKLPEVLLEDVLFQLFEGLYSQVKCPEACYFTNGEEIISYDRLHEVNGFIYVHFLERASQSTADRLEQKFRLCDLGELSRGIGRTGCRLFIFS